MKAALALLTHSWSKLYDSSGNGGILSPHFGCLPAACVSYGHSYRSKRPRLGTHPLQHMTLLDFFPEFDHLN